MNECQVIGNRLVYNVGVGERVRCTSWWSLWEAGRV